MTKWTLSDGRQIVLLTEKEFRRLPDGTMLISIMNERVQKGRDVIDDDTRGGYLAYGLPADHPQATAYLAAVEGRDGV